MSREAWISAVVMGALLWSIGTVSLLALKELVVIPIEEITP